MVVQTIVFRGLQTPMRRALLTWTACYGADPESPVIQKGRSRGEDLSGSRDKYPSRGTSPQPIADDNLNVLVQRRQGTASGAPRRNPPSDIAREPTLWAG